MTFEDIAKGLIVDLDGECAVMYDAQPEPFETRAAMLESYMRKFWDAATYAANVRAGDAGNEGEKHERMIKAAAAISILYPDREADWEKLKTIIQEAQG